MLMRLPGLLRAPGYGWLQGFTVVIPGVYLKMGDDVCLAVCCRGYRISRVLFTIGLLP
jgi:hypothetical protein